MRLLVTGGCGFIGSNFINYYFNANPNVYIINIDAMYYCANKNNIKEDIQNSDRYTLIRGNLCSMDLLTHILESYKIDTIIHFAAQSHVQNSFDDSIQYTHDNMSWQWRDDDQYVHGSNDDEEDDNYDDAFEGAVAHEVDDGSVW